MTDTDSISKIQPLPINLHNEVLRWCCRYWKYPLTTRPYMDALVNQYTAERVQYAIIYMETIEDAPSQSE